LVAVAVAWAAATVVPTSVPVAGLTGILIITLTREAAIQAEVTEAEAATDERSFSNSRNA